MPAKDPCKPFACKIQECLRGNRYQEPSCQKVIEDMKACCRKWGDDSFVCNGFKAILADESLVVSNVPTAATNTKDKL